jgi:hypothetical protein
LPAVSGCMLATIQAIGLVACTSGSLHVDAVMLCGPQMLFGVPTAQVAARVEALPAALGISKDEALQLLQDDPQFLLKAPATLAAGWKELRRAARKRPEWREQIGGWTAGTLCRCSHCFLASRCVWASWV